MTGELPASVLRGVPLPARRRWQPLRAGILGLFRYDEQVFTFHDGRLLLRGNNGSGKSMALEVLLPFVLDAHMAPERLSTFGGRERGMYLWLLDHEPADGRSNARGYVWVEFGRLTEDGPEFFTAGAGMQATRSSRKVTSSWYFTTGARIGVDFEVGSAGSEPLAQAQLDQKLTGLSALGTAGAVHPTADAHRKEVNRVLYGLEERQFESLREILLQLRKPKLSDKLSESKLSDILRDALPPVSTAVTDELADGFERLERHQDVIRKLRVARDSLATVARAYASYSEILVGLRAQDVVLAGKASDVATRSVSDARKAHHDAQEQLAQTKIARKKALRAVTDLTAEIKRIESSELYKEGSQLVPLLEKSAALANVAKTARRHAGEAVAAAGRLRSNAEKIDAERADAARRRDMLGARTDRIAPGLAYRAIPDLLGELLHDLEEPELTATDVESAICRVREAAGAEAETLEHLIGLVKRATDADADHRKAIKATAEVKQALAAAESRYAAAESARREAFDAFTALLTTWVQDCLQLVAGVPAPATWPGQDPLVAAQDWMRTAATARRLQISQSRTSLTTVRPVVAELGRRADSLADSVIRLGESHAALWPLVETTRAARLDFADAITDWLDGLRELLLGTAVPEELERPDARFLDRGSIVRWADSAARTRTLALAGRQSTVEAELEAIVANTTTVQDEYDRLVAGGITAPPVPVTRLDTRDDRPGAPFYLLVDFAGAERSAADRALLEAALVGSGLADAWVSPDGSLTNGPSGHPLLDTQLVLGGALAAAPLSLALRPDPAPEAPVPTSVIADLLNRIELADTASAAGDGLVVGWDGTWAAGSLHGAFRKFHADLIGAASREAQRQRRMAELEDQLARLEEQRLDVTGVLDGVKAAIEAVEAERAGVPPDTEVRTADEALAAALRELAAEVKGLRNASAAFTSAGADALIGAKNVPALMDHDWPAVELPVAELARNVADTADALSADSATMTESVWGLTPRRTAAGAVEASAGSIRFCSRKISALIDHTDIELACCDGNEAALDQEVGDVPPGDDLSTAASRVAVAKELVGAERTRLTGRQLEEAKARETSEEAAETKATALALAALPDAADRLPSYRTAVDRFRVSAEDWLNAAATAARLTAQARTAADEADAAAERAEQQSTSAEESEESARLAREDYAGLQERMGVPYKQMEGELQTNRADLQAQGDLVEKHTRGEAEQTGEVGRLGAEFAKAEEALAVKTVLVAESADVLADVHRLGLLVSHPVFAGQELPAIGSSPLREDQLELLRTWAAAITTQGKRAFHQQQLDDAQTKLADRRQEAEESLDRLIVLRERVESRIVLVTGTRNGRERPLAEALVSMDHEIEEAAQLLERDESELFEKFLSDEVRLEVGRRIDSAKDLLDRANDLMDGHPTSSGIKFKVHRTADPECEMPPDMLELLRKREGTLFPSERERLAEFFRRRIVVARGRATVVPWRRQLAELLDYRRWYKFILQFRHRDESVWAKVDRRAYGQMSGGEKAVALHMPLFAAAATHCEASRIRVEERDRNVSGCPRLILLDEVFAGVDTENRGALFDLISRLDLDLVATSESEQGLYAELNGLSIYHLIAEDGLPGVLAVRSIWDGHTEHRMLEHDLENLR
ncbi:SbcC/MukB-like Walker B domain-containing protein [Amycolatopsis sp. A133]|uniref:SbcC/MukB-like Walker B domain-containing protein n=1 Tax=Amycolatopsis sp. A133 TaxID=3064472 RepID=UPI0027F48A20|nr:SbcC/MukB-like Walker B domain-containing protein [Amycolatopsis sp. A133]MDQ7802678.1 SbcC/MukB-like Walker B domain-containing protein [Amycolatopsis sp. A133]